MSLSRRQLLVWTASASGLGACQGPGSAKPAPAKLPVEYPGEAPPATSPYADSVDALFDVLLPSERNESGVVVSQGAREVGVDQILEVEKLARLLVAQGLVSPVPEGVLVAFDDVSGVVRPALNRALDVRAQLERIGARFFELPRARQEAIVAQAFEDDATQPAMQLLRAACQLAYLGAVTNDVGLRQVGFPPFEDFETGLACSGYPRMRNGQVDDYTFNRAPQPTVGDDVSLILTPGGDLK